MINQYLTKRFTRFAGIRAEPIFFGGTPNNDTGVNMAILRYAGAPVKEPETNQTDLSALHEQTLTVRPTTCRRHDASFTFLQPLGPLYNISGTPDYSFVFDVSLNSNLTAFTMGGKTFTPPPVPVLLQILNGGNAFDLMPQGDVIPLRINSLVEITVPGGGAVAPVSLFFGFSMTVTHTLESTPSICTG